MPSNYKESIGEKWGIKETNNKGRRQVIKHIKVRYHGDYYVEDNDEDDKNESDNDK